MSASLYDCIPPGPTGIVLWTTRDERIVDTLVGPRRGIAVAGIGESGDKSRARLSRDVRGAGRRMGLSDNFTPALLYIGTETVVIVNF